MMKTLILNGSPSKNGNLETLINKFKKNLKGEVITVDSYVSDISPCIDCRYCKKHKQCKIEDDMKNIYDNMTDCDNLVIASPVYFSELSGSLLSLLSRLQVYYYHPELKIKPKKGILFLTGGGSGGAKKAEQTAKIIFNLLNVNYCLYAFSLNTDQIPARQDESALENARKCAEKLNDDFQ